VRKTGKKKHFQLNIQATQDMQNKPYHEAGENAETKEQVVHRLLQRRPTGALVAPDLPVDAVEKCSEPRKPSGRVKLVATLPASFASGAMRTGSYPWLSSPAAEGDKRGLDVTSRNIMSSEPAVGDKRRALDAPDTDHDDGCAEQGEGAGAAGLKPEQGDMRNKKLRRDGEARNLSQQQREERKAVIASIRQIDEMDYEEQAVKAGAWSTGLEDSVRHGNEKVGEERRFRDTCGTGWVEAAEGGPCGQEAGSRGEKLRDKTARVAEEGSAEMNGHMNFRSWQKEPKHMQDEFQGKGKEDVSQMIGHDKKMRVCAVSGCSELPLSQMEDARCFKYYASNVPAAKYLNFDDQTSKFGRPGTSHPRLYVVTGPQNLVTFPSRPRTPPPLPPHPPLLPPPRSAGTERNEQRGEGVGGLGAGGSEKCPHNRIKYQCKNCNGSICEHNRRKHKQKCPHNLQRSTCKQCGGASICEHNRKKHRCKECGGSSICEHNRRRSVCKPCGGASLCEHNRQRNTCKECGGASICEHNRRRSKCKQCGGASICEHNRQRSQCKECGGSGICEHNRRRSRCKDCRKSAV
jgi:hypothetical protein